MKSRGMYKNWFRKLVLVYFACLTYGGTASHPYPLCFLLLCVLFHLPFCRGVNVDMVLRKLVCLYKYFNKSLL
jgi:hypothetical protein